MDMGEMDGSEGDEVKWKWCYASLMPKAVTYPTSLCLWLERATALTNLSRFLHDCVVDALLRPTPTNSFAASC